MSDRAEKARGVLEYYIRKGRMERTDRGPRWIDGTDQAEHKRRVDAAYREANPDRAEYIKQYHRENAASLTAKKRERRHTDPEYKAKTLEWSRAAKARAKAKAAAASVSVQEQPPTGETSRFDLQHVWGKPSLS